MISFSFDDFPRSAYQSGGAVLEELGICATYYAAFGHMRSHGELAEEDLPRLVQEGNEVGCHTYTHASALSAPANVFEEECATNRAAAYRLIPEVSLENFAYPYGHTTGSIAALVGKHYRSARTTVAGINRDGVDLLRLRAVRVYDRLKNLPNLASQIEENTRSNGWLIFYTHDVSGKPSDYGCSPPLLRKVAQLARTSGAEILTVGEALRRVKPDDAAA